MKVKSVFALKLAYILMKLQFKCVDCGEVLGFYEGEEFYLSHSSVGYVAGEVKVVCKDCYKKKEGKTQ